MPSIGRSVALSSAANFGNLFISLALVIIVSRLLPPVVVGAYVLAYAVLLFIEPMRDLQIKSYIVLQPKADAQTLAPVYFLSALTSAGAFMATLGAAAIFYQTYSTPAVGNCLLIMAAGLIFRAWSKPAEGILQRERRYSALAVVRLGGALLKAAVTLALVLQGMGAEALAIGSLAEFAFELVGCAIVGRERTLVRPRAAGVGQVWAFCVQFGGAQLAGQLSAALDSVMIGVFQGLAATALFNRANRLVRTFRSGIEQAILPIALSEFATFKGDRERLRTAYLASVGALTAVTWPVLATSMVLAEPLVLGLFGAAWFDAIYLLQVLSVGAILHAASALSQQVHAAADEGHLLLKRELYLSLLRVVILAFTAHISTLAVAYGFVAMLAVSFVVNQGLLRRSFGITTGDFLRATWKSAAAAGVTTALVWLAMHWRPAGMTSLAAIAVFGALAAAIWLAALTGLRHPVVVELGRMVRRRRRPSAGA